MINKIFVSLLISFSVISSSIGSNLNCLVSDSSKIDCGYVGITEDQCAANGCCWQSTGDNSPTPWCFKASSQPITSYALSSSTLTTTSTGFVGYLNVLNPSSVYGADIQQLKLEVLLEGSSYLRVKISDSQHARWEVPDSIVDRPSLSGQASNLLYTFRYTNSPFTFEVTRNSDGASLFKSDPEFIYKDQYIQISTSIDQESKTFGIGESTRLEHALKNGSTYTLWAADIPALSFYSNLYGSFPYYLQMVAGKAHGVMLMNSNGMDVTITGDNDKITFKTIGGIVDLYVFIGPSPSEVVSQYTAVVGRPAMMPYWSLGFHNCKYGYTSIQQVEQVVANYSAAGIPLDTQWVDIDYMEAYKDFTTDPVAFPQSEVTSFVNQLHSNGQHFVPIIDPGIMVESGYDAYEEGLKSDIFIKDIHNGNYLGQVWPGPTHFPDFFNPNTQSYWTNQLKNFYNMVPVDGLWIDMNEISNFCNSDGKGQVCSNTAPSGCPAPGASQTDCCLSCSSVDTSNKYDFPPYAIHNKYGPLSTKTVAMSSMHYGNVPVYNAHNLYGISEQIATANALKDIRSKRPFLLTRSSFLGTGKFSAKWTGDNGATWNDLKSSVISIMDFNIFGVPMIGADICGFIFDTTEELCARWIEVGAFYPFSRNHNALGQAPQELYLWDSVTQAAKNALGMRYQLLPFLYTNFYLSHTQGLTVANPLFFTFPDDPKALLIDEQFMLGGAVMISPVLYAGQNSVNAYFPKGLWYNFAQRSLEVDSPSGGLYKNLQAFLTEVNVHVKGGTILPLQQTAMTTTAARKTPFTLFIALCPKSKASGQLYWDDGDQINLDHYLTAQYTASALGSVGELSSMVTITDSDAQNNFKSVVISTVIVLGRDISAPSGGAAINGQVISPSNINYDYTKHSLTFTGLSMSITENFKMTWN